MDTNSCAPYNFNNSNAWIQLHGGETREELQQMTANLDKERANRRIQMEINEMKLTRLQELVVTMRRERDEAVADRDEALNQLFILRQQLSQPPYHTNIIPKPLWPPNKPIGSSPLGIDSIPLQTSSTNLVDDEQDWDWPLFVRRFEFPGDEQDWDWPLFVRRFEFPGDREDDFHPQSTTSSSIDHSNLAQKQGVLSQLNDNDHEQQQRRDLNFLNTADVFQQLEQGDQSGLLRLVEDSTSQDLWHRETGVTHTSKHSMLGISEARGNMAYSNKQLRTGQILSTIDSNGCTVPAMPFHLPEPPEADPDIMLSTLPERGKFLQAVMQAGPLLNTILVAGPLPQWRHPPPTMDAVEMPVLSMCSPSPPLLVDHMQPPPPLAAQEALQVTSTVSCNRDVSNRLKEGQAFAPPASKIMCWPMMNSHDTAFTGPPLMNNS